MMGKDQIELIEDAHSERIWQPVFWVNSKTGPESIACNLLDTHSAAYAVAEKEADTFAAKEATKPISERRQVIGFGARNIDAPAPSQQQLRPVDSRLVNIDTLGKEIARDISWQRSASPAEHGLEVLEMTRDLMEQIAQRGFQLYREDCALPFLLGGIQAVHGGLRIKVEDAETLCSFYLGQADDLTQQQHSVSSKTPKEERAKLLEMLEKEEEIQVRGSLNRLATRLQTDRSNLGKKIKKAREERDDYKRAGGWVSTLVMDESRRR